MSASSATTAYLRDRAGKALREAEYQRKRAERLGKEVSELKTLIKLLWQWNNESTCGECPALNECRTKNTCVFWEWVRRRMEELGIEVDA